MHETCAATGCLPRGLRRILDRGEREFGLSLWSDSAVCLSSSDVSVGSFIAAQTFQKEWGANVVNIKDGLMLVNYENHYNARLNKCFIFKAATRISRTRP